MNDQKIVQTLWPKQKRKKNGGEMEHSIWNMPGQKWDKTN